MRAIPHCFSNHIGQFDPPIVTNTKKQILIGIHNNLFALPLSIHIVH